MTQTQVRYTQRFVKEFKKLPKRVQKQAIKKELIFKQNPHHPSLKTHALTGRLKGIHAFSVNYSYRIAFIFETNNSATFIQIGTHSIYK